MQTTAADTLNTIRELATEIDYQASCQQEVEQPSIGELAVYARQLASAVDQLDCQVWNEQQAKLRSHLAKLQQQLRQGFCRCGCQDGTEHQLQGLESILRQNIQNAPAAVQVPGGRILLHD